MSHRQMTVIIRPPSEESRLDEMRSAVRELRGAGHRVEVRVTFEAGDARRFAREAALAGCDVVAAAGGDGTVNEVVNGLMAVETTARLAVVPIGTANDFAKGLGLPVQPRAALRVAAGSACVSLDIAQVNRRCFVNVSTGGFGAAAAQTAGRGVKRRLGRIAYLLEGAQKLMQLPPGPGVFRADGEVVHDGAFVFFAVGNASLTGGGTRIAPRADPRDGRLDITIVSGVSRLDFLALLPDLRAGSHMESPDVRYLRATTFEVESRVPVPVNADGEAVAGRVFRYGVLSRPLAVLVPE